MFLLLFTLVPSCFGRKRNRNEAHIKPFYTVVMGETYEETFSLSFYARNSCFRFLKKNRKPLTKFCLWIIMKLYEKQTQREPKKETPMKVDVDKLAYGTWRTALQLLAEQISDIVIQPLEAESLRKAGLDRCEWPVYSHEALPTHRIDYTLTGNTGETLAVFLHLCDPHASFFRRLQQNEVSDANKEA